MRFNYRFVLLFLAGASCVLPPGLPARAATIDTLSGMNLDTAAESSLSLVSSILDVEGVSAYSAGSLNWSGTFSAAGWSASLNGNVNGQPVSAGLSGSTSGLLGSNVTIVNAAGGSFGALPFSFSSSAATWNYNPSISDYDEMDFDQVVLAGDPVSSEVQAREALSGAVANITNPNNVQNLLLQAALVGLTSNHGEGWANALATVALGVLDNGLDGADGAVSLSNARENPGLHNNPIGLPFFPAPGQNSSFVVPGQITIGLFDGPMLGVDLTGTAGLVATYDTGSFSGTISAVPEPGFPLLFGIIGIAALTRRGRASHC